MTKLKWQQLRRKFPNCFLCDSLKKVVNSVFVLVYLQGVVIPDWHKSSGFLRRPQKCGIIFLMALTLLINFRTLFLWPSQDIWTLQHLTSLFGYGKVWILNSISSLRTKYTVSIDWWDARDKRSAFFNICSW